jgi:YegS/Rv2252/BmrU family lipid kinase
MLQQKYLFVVNPIAGGKDKTYFFQVLQEYSANYEIDYEVYITNGKDDHEKISKQIAHEEPDVVVAVGGDGTLLLVAEILIYTPIQMGIIPMGSANGMARELEIPTNEEDALETLLNGRVRNLDMIHINHKRYCLHIADIGFNAKIVKNFQENQLRGLLGYALHFLREFHSMTPQLFEIEVDGKTISRLSYMIAFANAQKYGTGAILNPLGQPDDGIFEICILKELSFLSMIDMLLTTENYSEDHLEIIPCKKAIIRCKKPLPLQSDGEILEETTSVYVEIVPKCLNLITT